jgi:hypothetical protein
MNTESIFSFDRNIYHPEYAIFQGGLITWRLKETRLDENETGANWICQRYQQQVAEKAS